MKQLLIIVASHLAGPALLSACHAQFISASCAHLTRAAMSELRIFSVVSAVFSNKLLGGSENWPRTT